jgi:membrane protein
MFPLTSIRIVYRACEKWSENGGMRLGAALAFYALFSIAPLLLIAVHVCGAVFGEEAARDEVRRQLNAFLGEEIAVTVQHMMQQAAEPRDTQWTPSLSLVILLVAALGALLHVRSALCMIWKLDPPHGNGWLGMLWDYGLSLIMVLLISVLLLTSLAIGLVIPILRSRLATTIADGQFWQWMVVSGAFLFQIILFGVLYRTLSGGRISWGYVLYGAFIAAVLYTVGKVLLAYYIEYSDVESMYGAAGSLVVFLIWVYYSSQVFFFGAELIQARRTRHEWMT